MAGRKPVTPVSRHDHPMPIRLCASLKQFPVSRSVYISKYATYACLEVRHRVSLRRYVVQGKALELLQRDIGMHELQLHAVYLQRA